MSDTIKILVVDDEFIGRQLLEAILIPEGYHIFFGNNGEDALKIADIELPDIILLDVMMPKMDGFEVCKKLRQNSTTAHIPVFLITALDDRDSLIRGIDAGADDYISKPFNRIEVIAKIKNKTSQIHIRSKSSNLVHAGSADSSLSRYNEALIDSLIEIINHNNANEENLTLIRSQNVMDSQHTILNVRSQHGNYICLISNKLPVKDSSIANSIYFQFVIQAMNKKEYQPHKLLAYCNACLGRLIDDSGLKMLNSAAYSVIVLFFQNESKEVTVCGHDYSIFICQQPTLADDDQLDRYQTYTLQVNHDLKFNSPGKIILLSKNILDQIDLPDIVTILNTKLIDLPKETFVNQIEENFKNIDDFLVAQLTF